MLLAKFLLLFCLHQALSLHVHVSDLGPEKVKFELEEAEELFKEFIDTFHKLYKNTREYRKRLKIFKRNLRDINERNEQSTSEVYGITEFIDLTDDEFQRQYTGLNFGLLPNDTNSEDFQPLKLGFSLRNVPEHWDWRKKGLVGPVKNQGHCNSCWSFGAIGCVEGQYAKKHKKFVSFSEQQLVDCFKEGGGCSTGSFPHLGLNYAAKMGGLMSSADYPYTGRTGTCRFKKNKVAVKVLGGKRVNIQNEEQLKQLVYEHGPVSIAINAQRAFSEYKGHIARPETLDCRSGQHPNHAVLVVGYGEENGTPYWIIKNSYGHQWGEQGYMRLIRGKNACSILEYASTAEIA